MLDSADLKQALKVTSADLKQALKVTNRNERAADAVAALVGKSVALNAIPKLSDIPEKQKNLSAANKFWLICTALLNKTMPAF